jgi:hypothetical protein
LGLLWIAFHSLWQQWMWIESDDNREQRRDDYASISSSAKNKKKKKKRKRESGDQGSKDDDNDEISVEKSASRRRGSNMDSDIQPVGFSGINRADGAIGSNIRLSTSSNQSERKTIDSLSSGLKSLRFMKRNEVAEEPIKSNSHDNSMVLMTPGEREIVDDNRWTLVPNQHKSSLGQKSPGISNIILASDSDEIAELTSIGRVSVGGFVSSWKDKEETPGNNGNDSDNEDINEDDRMIRRLANLKRDREHDRNRKSNSGSNKRRTHSNR